MNEKTDVEMGATTVSVADTSRILRVDERTVRRYCDKGKLVSCKPGKAIMIELASVLAMLEDTPTPGADSDTDSGNGRAVSDREIVDTENTAAIFQQVRTAISEHLQNAEAFHQNTKTFHRTLLEDVAALERAVAFEQKRNQKTQTGLDGILKQLNLSSADAAPVSVDVRPERGILRRAWGWVATKKRRMFAVGVRHKDASKA